MCRCLELRRFRSAYNLTLEASIESIIPVDFNLDGKLDLVIFTKAVQDGGWWGAKKESLRGWVYFGGGVGGAPRNEPLAIDHMLQQPLVFDADGTMRPDMLAVSDVDAETGQQAASAVKVWRNRGELEIESPPFDPLASMCELAMPASHAFVDLDGDCLADVFLTCKGRHSNAASFQVWRNTGHGYVFGGEWKLPEGAGAISFADMDRDGTIDLVFPTCHSVSSSTGMGRGCSINIAYNKQKPLCRKATGSLLGGWQAVMDAGNTNCRDPERLCEADDEFGFELDPDGDVRAKAATSAPLADPFLQSFTSIPIDRLFPGTTSLLFSDSGSLLPLRIGDYDVDGFPDLMLLVVNGTAAPSHSLLGRSAGIQARLLHSSPGDGRERRLFEPATGAAFRILEDLWDVRNAAWIDVDEDGSLDIVLQRSGKQDGRRVTFVQNNLFSDAFFLKTTTLNGACEGGICDSGSGVRYKAYGAALPGSTYKFAVLDTAGRRVVNQVAGLSQTAYNALQLPYSFFGLGRTNNYVEKLFVGSTRGDERRFTDLEGVIPNSHVIFNPPREPDAPEVVLNPSTSWHSSLYIKPGDWVPWVVATILGIMVILASIIWSLHKREKVRHLILARKIGADMDVDSTRTSWSEESSCIGSISRHCRSDYVIDSKTRRRARVHLVQLELNERRCSRIPLPICCWQGRHHGRRAAGIQHSRPVA